jgi:thiamine pyrophosphate-dependent acetolactate synthase large subunit-like protein
MRKDSSIILRKFVERIGICSVNTFMAKGVISDRSERHLQTIGIKEADYALTEKKQIW